MTATAHNGAGKQIDRRTWRLLDQLGRVGEKHTRSIEFFLSYFLKGWFTNCTM